MRLNTSYRQILAISGPIMLGSAAQNVITLSDNVFLYHLGETDFAAIGFVGVFYLVIAAIGYGFSRGGQIMIARRMGEGQPYEVGRTFYAMFYYELCLGLVMFAFMKWGAYGFFDYVLEEEVILRKSMEYLEYRSWGIFFSYTGVAIIALYSGVARPTFILIDTIILAIVNIILNYALIYGHFGLPAMGIAGAALASTIAEIVAFICFVVYILLDKKNRIYRLFHLPKFDLQLVWQQFTLAFPIVAQAFVGIGSWFVFFAIIENLGERQLSISNLGRNVYLILSIPCWGFASGINTLVSNFIGQQKRQAVVPIIWKTAKLCWLITMLFTIPVVFFPHQLLYPLLGSEDMSLITEAQPIFYVLIPILTSFAIGGVFFNGMAGTGATQFGLMIQAVCALVYLAYIYLVVNFTNLGLPWAWAAEILYWVLMLALTYWYLVSRRWHRLKV